MLFWVGCCVCCRLAGSTLRLSYLQDALGDSLFYDIALGRNPYLFAALKSLPLSDTGDNSSMGADGTSATTTSSSSGSSNDRLATPEEKELAAALQHQVDRELASCATSLVEDQLLLQQLEVRLQEQQQKQAAGTPAVSRTADSSEGSSAPSSSISDSSSSGGSSDGGSTAVQVVDPRLLAAVQYRLERKRLLQAAQVALRVFQRD